MSKKSKKSEPKLSKKEQRKIAEKAAAKREREVDRVDKKAAKKALAASDKSNAKAAKKGKGRHPALRHLDRVGELSAIVNDPNAKKSARKEAQAELDRLRAEGQARIDAKDAAAAATAEKTPAEIDAEIRERVLAKRAEREGEPAPLADVKAARMPDALEGESEADYQMRKLREKDATRAAEKPAKGKKAKAAPEITAVEGTTGETLSATEPPSEAPAPLEEEFGKPSESALFEDRTNGLGQYLVQRPSDEKEVGYTRVTTYIDTLEDKSTLTKWKMRILLEGIAVADEQAALSDDRSAVSPIITVRDLVHRRDVAIAKARKADRKGKLVPGQLATLTDGAWSDFKKALDKLADEVFEIGGGREKAQKGTDIHALCDLYDSEGIAAVGAKLEAGEITPADLADVEAYAEACRALGLKVVASEQVVVNDDLKVAGRLDRVYLAKLPEIRDPKSGEIIFAGDTRARRYVGDVKTGRVDLGAGKIAQQIRLYAESKAYDHTTGERSSHGANRTHGLLIHLPAGSAKATIHLVDLGIGGAGNKLSGEVRQFRNTGKRAFDVKIDVVAAARQAAEDAAEPVASDVAGGE